MKIPKIKYPASRRNPFGNGGVKKGEKRNPTGKGGFIAGDPASRLRILKGNMTRAKRLSQEHSKQAKRRAEAKAFAMEIRDVQELAKRSMKAGLDRVNKIIADEKSQDHTALACVAFLADRAYGKAVQPNLNASVNENGSPNEISDAELAKRIDETLSRINAITGGKTKPPKGKK